MKKNHEDRMKLIDRLERKYVEKVRLRRQEGQRDIKNALRRMRGQQLDIEDIRIDYVDDIFRHGPKTA